MKRWEKYRKEMYGNEKLTLDDIIKDIEDRCSKGKFGTNCERCPMKDAYWCVGTEITLIQSIKYLEEVYHENN